jgi:PAS domain S-box-containing protein
MRDTGIELIGSVPWGTHFCQFYQEAEDLLDVLVPYFAAGLARNEYCLWVTSEPLGVEEARAALTAAIGNLDAYLSAGQLEILDYRQWCTTDGKFEADRVLRGWVDKVDAARRHGFAGLRLSRDTRWLEAADWTKFTIYEGSLDHLIGEYPMLALCTYQLSACGTAEVLDVVSHHAFALIKREGTWQVMRNDARKRYESSLQQSEEDIRAIMDAAHESIYLFAADGTILAINTTAASKLGSILHEVVGHHFSEFVPPHLVESRKARLRDVVLTGQSVRFVDEGNGIIYDHHFYPIFEGDQVRRVAAVSQDITERKRAEAAAEAQLRASEEQFRAAFESAAIGIEQLDLEGHFLLGNAKLAEILGMTLEEIHKLTFAHITHPDDLLREEPLLEQLLAGKRPSYTIEKRFLHKDGYPVWVRVTSSLTQGNPQRFLILIIEDITARKQVEEALRQTATELARSNKELGLFASVASHDLQEPLRAVSGYVTLLEERLQSQLDAKAQQYIAGAIEGAGRMQRLITDLLALSRVGTQGKAFMPVDFNSVLNQALQCVSTSIQETEAEISNDPLPTLDADAEQMVQLFQNLIGNAIKFCGTHPPIIHIGVERRGDYWHFSVHDNGIGIEAQYYDRVFLIFQRLHTRTQYPGTGIGLAICQKIIERHGGTIWVESQPGNGSTFFFTIPSKGRYTT